VHQKEGAYGRAQKLLITTAPNEAARHRREQRVDVGLLFIGFTMTTNSLHHYKDAPNDLNRLTTPAEASRKRCNLPTLIVSAFDVQNLLQDGNGAVPTLLEIILVHAREWSTGYSQIVGDSIDPTRPILGFRASVPDPTDPLFLRLELLQTSALIEIVRRNCNPTTTKDLAYRELMLNINEEFGDIDRYLNTPEVSGGINTGEVEAFSKIFASFSTRLGHYIQQVHAIKLGETASRAA
jgi:hypothetical protein